MVIKEVVTQSMVEALSELYSPFLKERQLQIHCSNSEWAFSKHRISVTEVTTAQTAQIEIKWDLINLN